ncbi:MAG TPA: sugar ABC transporter permease, partial [Bacillus bacterium]|nr:sugar ABC transporter permease [Bacillus sp. (in: firmicutes)]
MDAKLPLQKTSPPKQKFELFQFLYKYGTIFTIFALIGIFSAANPSFINGDNII